MAKRTCKGTTKKGTPCGSTPMRSGDYCWRHADFADAPHGRTERWDRQAFLDAFDELGMVTAACEAIGISRQTAYQERQRNEDFAVAWADVEERSTERMEREAYRRAVEGVTKPLVSAGKHVTDVTEYSDGLLQFMLRARRPERYRENVKVEHAGGIEQRVRLDLSRLPPDKLEALEEITGLLEQ